MLEKNRIVLVKVLVITFINRVFVYKANCFTLKINNQTTGFPQYFLSI